jgi:hypothetical protein
MPERMDIAIVIALLGGLVSVAVPRHLAVGRETAIAEVTSLARSAGTALRLAHVTWQAAGTPAAIDGARGIVAITHGYPSVATVPLMLSDAETQRFSYADGVWQHRSSQPGQRCGVAYVPPAAPDLEPALRALTEDC